MDRPRRFTKFRPEGNAQMAKLTIDEWAERAFAAESKLDRMRNVLGQFDRDEIDDGDAFVAMCSILEEQPK